MYELSTQFMTTPAMVSHDVGHRFVQKSTRLRRTAACGLGSANVAPCNGFSRIVQDLSQEVISYEDVVHSPLEDISRLSATSNQSCNNSNIDTCNAVLNILRKNRSLKRAQSSMKSSLTNLVCGDERRLADTTISRQMNLHSRENRSICGMPTNCFIQNIDDKETLVQIGDKSTSREGHSDRSNMHHMYGYTADEKQDISKSVFSSLRNSSKVCSRCGTSKTPLWRSGPLGPKSLCNACGIRLKKTGRSTAKLDLEETSLLHEPSPRMLFKASISDEYDRHTNKKSRLSISIGETEKRFESEGDDSITETLHQDITREHAHCETAQLSHRNSSLGRIFARKKSANESRMAHTATRDEEEGAILLMALSCGYINTRS